MAGADDLDAVVEDKQQWESRSRNCVKKDESAGRPCQGWGLGSHQIDRLLTKMIKCKYQISGKTDEEIWVCEACRNVKNEVILTGKWKLIDRRGDAGILFALCEEKQSGTSPESSTPGA